MKRTLSIIVAASAMAFAASASAADQLAVWKDAVHCSAPGAVISAKVSKHKKSDVDVKVKLKSGKTTTSTVNNAKVSDFPPGSAYCANDYSGD